MFPSFPLFGRSWCDKLGHSQDTILICILIGFLLILFHVVSGFMKCGKCLVAESVLSLFSCFIKCNLRVLFLVKKQARKQSKFDCGPLFEIRQTQNFLSLSLFKNDDS